MAKAWNNVLQIADIVFLMTVLPGYIFILVVNLLDWIKNKRLDISDQLITGIGFLSLIHRIFQMSVSYTLQRGGFQLITHYEWLIFALTYLYLSLCTLLFSMWLSIYFCLKIVTMNQNLYTYVQHRFPKMFPWILLTSVIAALLMSGPAAQDMAKQYVNLTTVLPHYSPLNSFLSLKLYFVVSSLCFLILLTSVLVTIVSLYRHIRRMQKHATNFRAETVEAHVHAVKTLICLLAFNLLYFSALIISVVEYGRTQWARIVFFLYAICHVLCFLLLIRGSSKLQKQLRALQLRCSCLKRTSG